ncbi:hypothetical protein F4803DRAFT_557930 [Xylaria telfairii]|nr:hypothetical protein F4803DRAFT_557930 [Xylaria telfairii]
MVSLGVLGLLTHHLVLKFCLYTLVIHSVFNTLWFSEARAPHIQDRGDLKSFRGLDKRNGAVHTLSTSPPPQHLSIETVIAIVSLISAVVIVPCLSKYVAGWINQHHRRPRNTQASEPSSASLRNVNLPRPTRETHPLASTHAEINALEGLQMPAPVHPNASRSAPAPASRLPDRLGEDASGSTTQHHTTILEEESHELKTLHAIREAAPS